MSSGWWFVRSSPALLCLLALAGCFGVHIGHAPPVPYPITELDLDEPAPRATEGRLPAQFQIPVLRSLAPDPVWVAFNDRRQIAFTERRLGEVPPAMQDAFHGRVGGSAGAAIEVQVVIERLFTGCYPVRIGGLERGQHSFIEAFVDFGEAGGRRLRFSLHEPGCTLTAEEAFAQLGDALASETILLAGEVR